MVDSNAILILVIRPKSVRFSAVSVREIEIIFWEMFQVKHWRSGRDVEGCQSAGGRYRLTQPSTYLH